jgi:hypothetical protein
MRPIFSICHTTARPNEWRAGYEAWCAAAQSTLLFEYVLCLDERWGFDPQNPPDVWRSHTHIVWNQGRKCSVDGWNTAAAAARGQVLILNADDFRPPESWDKKLLEVIPDLKNEFVIEVSSSKPASEQRLLVLGILSRRRYERLGYALYPEYESMYSDNEFTEHARKDQVVIDARHLEFHHYHPMCQEAPWDIVYDHQNQPRCYQEGAAILNRRRAEGFPVPVRV